MRTAHEKALQAAFRIQNTIQIARAASAIDIASRDMQWIRLFCTSLIIVFNRHWLPQVASLFNANNDRDTNVYLMFVFNGSL